MADRLKDIQSLLDYLSPTNIQQDEPMIFRPEDQMEEPVQETIPALSQSLVDNRTAQAMTEASMPKTKPTQKIEPVKQKIEPVEPPTRAKSYMDAILEREGFREKVYDDATGKTLTPEDIKKGNYKGFPTVGYGHKLSPQEIKSGKLKSGESIYGGLTSDRAAKLAESSTTLKDVSRQISKLEGDLKPTQIDALYEFGYNVGSGNLSKVIKTINEKGIEAGADHLRKFVKSNGKRMKGLVKRREIEALKLLGEEPAQLESLLDAIKGGQSQRSQENRAVLMDIINSAAQQMDQATALRHAADPGAVLDPIYSRQKFDTENYKRLMKERSDKLKKQKKMFKVGSSLIKLDDKGNPQVLYKDPIAEERIKLMEQRQKMSDSRLELMKEKEKRLSRKDERSFQDKQELSDKQLKELESLDNGLIVLDDIEKLFPKVKNNLGFYASKGEEYKRYIPGVERDPEFVKMQQLVGLNLADYVKSISGAAVSEQEAQRLLKNIPNMDDKPTEFMTKINKFRELLNKYRGNKLKLAKDAQGKMVEMLEKKTPAGSEKIVVTLPDGRKGTIHKDKIEAFKKKYPSAIIEE